MYLDNIIKSAQTASVPEVTYSEIMEDTLRMVEVEGAGELALLKAEATKQILGTEAPAEWWAKIKTVARKIFEMLKNLITKVFAFIKSIPNKLATVANRIAAAVVNVGLEDKIKRLNKMGDTEWKDKALKNLEDREFDGFYTGLIEGVKQTAEAKALLDALDKKSDALKNYNDTVAKFDKDDESLEEKIRGEKEKVIAAKQAVSDAADALSNKKVPWFKTEFTNLNLALKFARDYAAFIKNKKYATAVSKVNKDAEQSTRDVASKYRLAMAAYEKAVRDENEEKVKQILAAAKNYRWAISESAASASLTTRWMSHDLLLGARLTSAILSSVSKSKTPEDLK